VAYSFILMTSLSRLGMDETNASR